MVAGERTVRKQRPEASRSTTLKYKVKERVPLTSRYGTNASKSIASELRIVGNTKPKSS